MTTFGLAALPTNVDGSAGRDKSDVRPVPDLSTHVQSSEWNTVKRAVVEMAAAMGRSAGEDPASIAAALLGMTSGPRTDAWSVADDFMVSRSESVKTTTGTGHDAILRAASAAGDGAGHLYLSHGAAAGSVIWRPETENLVAGSSSPRCRFRFKTPANLTLSDARVGISDAGEANYAWIGWDHTTQLKLYCESQDGTLVGTTNAMTLVASTWYELEIRVVSGVSVGLYDASGALIVQDTTAGRVLQLSDKVQPFMAKLVRFGAASDLVIDWYAARGSRL